MMGMAVAWPVAGGGPGLLHPMHRVTLEPGLWVALPWWWRDGMEGVG